MQKLLDMLKRHEGVMYYVYDDHLGYATIGVGRCVEKNVGLGLSHDEIEYLLQNDVNRCIEELDSNFTWYRNLCEARRDAMINLCFNLGLPRLKKFVKALAAMEAGNYQEAAVEFLDSRWAKQVGTRALEVTHMIRSGEYV
jgi:lysozyme